MGSRPDRIAWPSVARVSQRARLVVATAALILQFAVLYTPRAPAVAVEGLPLDKLVHVVIFALPTYALIRAGLPVVTVAVLMAAQAVGSELLQHMALANRSGDAGDVLADLVGVGIGVALVRRRSPRASPRSGDRSHRGAPS